MEICLATQNNLAELEELYDHARQFMKENGIPNQWGDFYPLRDVLEADIQKQQMYLCVEDGQLLAAFVFHTGPDESYGTIRDGSWKHPELDYWVIHRVASFGKVPGAAAFCLDWCKKQADRLRIDTHQDNLPMQRLIAKSSFERRGIIQCAHTGDERIAYEYSSQ